MGEEKTDRGRERVEWLTPENWRTSGRTRVSAGVWMGARVERAEAGYVGIYGNPPGFGARREFETLEEALLWANRDEGGVMLVARDEGIEATFHFPPERAG